MPSAENIGSKESKPSSQDQMKIVQLEKKFDPHDHGMDDGYGLWGAAVHIFRYTFGAGVLLLPYTMKTIGYVNGIILLSLVSIFYYHNMHILISLEYRLCKLFQVKQISYSSLSEKVFQNAPHPLNKFGAVISKVLLVYFCVTAYTSTYLLVFASSVQNLAKYFDYNLNITYIITVAMVPILIFSMFKKLLKILVPFSAVTNFCSIVMAAVLVTCCVIYRDPKATARPFGDLNFIPQTVAAYIQAIICTPSILPVKNYMKQPQRMGASCGALNVTALIIIFLFINFSVITYFCFGDNIQEDILSNLPKNGAISFIMFLLYAVVMLVMYLLGFSVILDNVWFDMDQKLSHSKLKVLIEYGTRIALNAWAYLLAVGMPNLGLILTISGTVAMVFEVAMIPALEVALIFRSKKKCIWTIFKDLVIIIISVTLCYMSLKDCVKEVKKLYSE